MINTKEILTKLVAPVVPVAQLLLTAYSAYKPLTHINAGDLVGYSIFTGIVYLVFFKYSYKEQNKYIPLTCSVGLVVMNFISILKSHFKYKIFELTYDWSTFIVCSGCLFFIVNIYYLKKKEYIKIKRK